MLGKKTRLLVLAPHVDDELNCAGTIARVTAAGGTALIFACSPAYLSVPADCAGKDIVGEFHRSCGILRAEGRVGEWTVRRLGDARQEILEAFVLLARSVEPTLVLCPSSTDGHQDHRVVYLEAMRAFRNAPRLLGWESPNNQRTARIDTFVQLEASHLEDKVLAWRQYETQHHRDYFDEGMLRQLAGVRGKQCRCASRLAEGFEHLSATL
jgi:LmbE family N-acetylglucosaminyl deacetylase